VACTAYAGARQLRQRIWSRQGLTQPPSYSTEAEYAKKLADLLEKHQAELADKTPLDAGPEPIQTDVVPPEDEQQQQQQQPQPPSEKEKKLEKAKRKKEKQKEKERLYQEELAEISANAGPSMRKLELERLDAQLVPLALKISEIQSDGNCLYRAVAAQCGMDYAKVRECNSTHTQTFVCRVSGMHCVGFCLPFHSEQIS
jgi:hypothetical protein